MSSASTRLPWPTIANRLGGEARPVLYAAEAFFLGSCYEHPVFDKAGGGIAVVGIETEEVSHFSD